MKLTGLLWMMVAWLACAASLNAQTKGPLPHLSFDMKEFLASQDPVWEQLPRQWNEGAFVGNGQLGMMIYATLKENRLDFHLGRQDVTDHRKASDRKSSMGVEGASVMWDFPRLDIGRMALHPAGKIQDGTMRIDLWNAEVTGSMVTSLGKLTFRAFTPRDRMVQIIQVSSTETHPDGTPARWEWKFLPGNPASPRAQVFPQQAKDARYITNPNPVLQQTDGVSTCVQSLNAGGDYATAWMETGGTGVRSTTLYVPTANEVPAADKSAAVAAKEVKEAAIIPMTGHVEPHRDWWHQFYRKSFVTVPDPRTQAFYWIQLYKFASASREGGPAVDLFGPWFRVSQWPGIWWNLNIQLTYWPVYASNHLDLGNNYLDVVDAHFDALLKGFANAPTLGDFGWAMHNYWWQLRFAGDCDGVKNRWHPKAKAVVQAYLPRLKKNDKGQLELSEMGSPEYHGFKTYPNTTYNLAILRWLLSSLLEADARSGGKPDPDAKEWQRILTELIPYPEDQNGLRIASNQAVDMSHRHFSHLLGLYPLYQLDPNSEADREKVVRSVKHWHKIGDGKALAGYSFTGGTSLYASLGMGNEAYGMLHQFLNGNIGISELLPNTFYVESGGRNPVIETPLSAASATLDLLLQSWGGKIRVFPAMPDDWKDAAFHQLRAMDGFLVSASRKDHATQWIYIFSEAGNPCTLRMPEWSGPLNFINPTKPGSGENGIKELEPGEWSLNLKKGEGAFIFPSSHSSLNFEISPLPIKDSDKNAWGVKKGKHLKKLQAWPEVPLPQTP